MFSVFFRQCSLGIRHVTKTHKSTTLSQKQVKIYQKFQIFLWEKQNHLVLWAAFGFCSMPKHWQGPVWGGEPPHRKLHKHRCGYKVKLHRSCLTTTTNSNTSTTQRRRLLSQLKKETIYQLFSTILRWFSTILWQFSTILWWFCIYNGDFTTILRWFLTIFTKILRRFFDDSAYTTISACTTISQRLYNDFA